MKNILIWAPSVFDIGCGGLNVQYELCRILKEYGVNVKIFSPVKKQNPIFNDYYDNNFDLNETIVIYGETIQGNPLNAPYVVRWILAPLGICSHPLQFRVWGKNDLVYYFNPEKKMKIYPNKLGNVYKLLSIVYISPYIKNNNKEPRSGSCYTIRKANEYHNNQIEIVHPSNSFEVVRNHSLLECVDIFNTYECFYSYDPCTFLNIIAAISGCISVVIKVKGQPKNNWLNTLAPIEYLKETGEPLYGVAYGPEEIEFAKSTLHLVEGQWININKFFRKKYVESFITDINSFETQPNTVENNFYKWV
jgi:hypothetical protein